MARKRLDGNIYPRIGQSPFVWLWYRNEEGEIIKRASHFKLGQEANARLELDEILRQVAAGETPATGPGTTAALIERWLAERRARGKRSVDHEAARLREYVIPRIGKVPAAELRPTQVRALIREIQLLPSYRGGKLAARTVLHVYRTLRQVFSEAVADELLDHNPVVLKKADLPAKYDKDPSWRRGAQFSPAEVAALIFDPRVPEDRRALYAIELLGGLRTGEAAARRWRDWEAEAQPLGRLAVDTSYDSRARLEGPTKTKRPRSVPVHPIVDAILRRWKADGWPRAFGHPPAPDDLICPSVKGTFRNNSLSHRHFVEDLDLLGLRRRRHYDTRRTFITLSIAGGGRKDVLRWITHSPGDVLDEYTTPPWASLCEAVAAIRVEPPPIDVGLRLVAVTRPVTEPSAIGRRSPGYSSNVAEIAAARKIGRAGESKASDDAKGSGPEAADLRSSETLQEGAGSESAPIGTETGAPRNNVTAAEEAARRAGEALAAGDVRAARRLLLDALRALEDEA